MSEKSFLAREPRLRSENTYLISPQDLTNRRLKRSNVAKPTPRRPSPYPPVVKKKPAKMVTRSSLGRYVFGSEISYNKSS